MKKIMLVSFIAMGVMSTSAHAEREEIGSPAPSTGVVKFHGSVVESPCFLHLDSAEQTVELGEIAKTQLDEEGGRSPAKPFQIKLEKCDTAGAAKTFTIAFNGTAGDSSELSVAEAERGVAVVINDNAGNAVSFDGSPSDKISMTDGQNVIDFTAFVKKANGGEVLPGEFSAQTNFTIDYK